MRRPTLPCRRIKLTLSKFVRDDYVETASDRANGLHVWVVCHDLRGYGSSPRSILATYPSEAARFYADAYIDERVKQVQVESRSGNKFQFRVDYSVAVFEL